MEIIKQRETFINWFNQISSEEKIKVVKDENEWSEEAIDFYRDELDFIPELSMINIIDNIITDAKFLVCSFGNYDDDKYCTINMVYFKNILLEIIVEFNKENKEKVENKRFFFQAAEMKKDSIINNFCLIMKDKKDFTKKEYIDCVDKNEIDIMNLLSEPETDNNIDPEDDEAHQINDLDDSEWLGSDWI